VEEEEERAMRDVSELDRSDLLARLHAALESVETTRSLVSEIRAAEPLRHPRPELAGVVELVGRARELLRTVILDEAA
jgi:hypothetical protein